MKPGLFLSGIMLLSVISACNREHLNYNHCYEDLTGTYASGLPSNVEDSALALLDSNHVDISRLAIWRVNADEQGGESVLCYQFVNGLRVFEERLVYQFDQNKTLSYIWGDVVDSVNLSPVPRMDRQQVMMIYVKAVLLDDNPFFNWQEQVFSSCHTIELGYYWKNINEYPAPHKYTRAWLVKTKGLDYPEALIDDQTSALLHYSDGIVVDHWGM